ncbi:MAG: Gfo/Idh/MocA family protein, partial [Flavobacteriaceae bacterium]
RDVYDKHINEIDAIMVATPDHTHACISLPFMRAKKHAYVEKPLTHNIYEARIMADTAKKENIVTQMGNQGVSGGGSTIIKHWIEKGEIGKVTKID